MNILRYLVFVTFFALVWAVSSVPDKQMNDWLNCGGLPLAMAAQPMWFFGQSQNQPHVTQHGLSSEANKPQAGTSVSILRKFGNPGPDFPIYYTYNKCNNNGIRVVYNIFFDKDGVIWGGHRYDWEHAIVVWARGRDNVWSQSRLFMSQHRGYDKKNWEDIQNTFHSKDANKPRDGQNGKKYLAHPKVYVGWSKHAIFHDRNTFRNDVGSQIKGLAFRSRDWWYYPTKEAYVRADRSTKIGDQIAHLDWGEASSTPANVHDQLCSISCISPLIAPVSSHLVYEHGIQLWSYCIASAGLEKDAR